MCGYENNNNNIEVYVCVRAPGINRADPKKSDSIAIKVARFCVVRRTSRAREITQLCALDKMFGVFILCMRVLFHLFKNLICHLLFHLILKCAFRKITLFGCFILRARFNSISTGLNHIRMCLSRSDCQADTELA